MTKIQATFYGMVLPLEKNLPKLLEKAIESKQRCLVLVESKERLLTLNSILWSYSTQAFLPHGYKDVHEQWKDQQPIWLTCEIENPNNSTIFVNTCGFDYSNSQGNWTSFETPVRHPREGQGPESGIQEIPLDSRLRGNDDREGRAPDEQVSKGVHSFTRYMDLFDSKDESSQGLALKRQQDLNDMGVSTTLWQQTTKGNWEKSPN